MIPSAELLPGTYSTDALLSQLFVGEEPLLAVDTVRLSVPRRHPLLGGVMGTEVAIIHRALCHLSDVRVKMDRFRQPLLEFSVTIFEIKRENCLCGLHLQNVNQII